MDPSRNLTYPLEQSSQNLGVAWDDFSMLATRLRLPAEEAVIATQDLSTIHGIGPPSERRLKAAGTKTVAELLHLTAPELASLLSFGEARAAGILEAARTSVGSEKQATAATSSEPDSAAERETKKAPKKKKTKKRAGKNKKRDKKSKSSKKGKKSRSGGQAKKQKEKEKKKKKTRKKKK